jgi:hypothetical protein
LIGRYLRVGVELPDGSREATLLGVPQGGPLSPLLANIVLDPLDKPADRLPEGRAIARHTRMPSGVGGVTGNPVTPTRLKNTLGANPKLAETAQSEDELRQAVAFPAARGPICGS